MQVRHEAVKREVPFREGSTRTIRIGAIPYRDCRSRPTSCRLTRASRHGRADRRAAHREPRQAAAYSVDAPRAVEPRTPSGSARGSSARLSAKVAEALHAPLQAAEPCTARHRPMLVWSRGSTGSPRPRTVAPAAPDHEAPGHRRYNRLSQSLCVGLDSGQAAPKAPLQDHGFASGTQCRSQCRDRGRSIPLRAAASHARGKSGSS